MKKDLYQKKEVFQKDFEYFKRNKMNFTREYTNYTECIKFDDFQCRYNDTGENDAELLHIINLVKRDAQNYLKYNRIKKEYEITWTHLKEVPERKNFYKVDIVSAYWEVAKSRGIISESTNLKAMEYADRLYRFLNETPEEYEKRKKSRFKYLRTRSVGALATRKKIEKYVNGELVYDKLGSTIIQNERMRNLYLQICEDIDALMLLIIRSVPGAFFYYWDCIFVFPEGLEKAVAILNDNGFQATIEPDIIDVIPLSENRIMLETEISGKMYNVKPV